MPKELSEKNWDQLGFRPRRNFNLPHKPIDGSICVKCNKEFSSQGIEFKKNHA